MVTSVVSDRDIMQKGLLQKWQQELLLSKVPFKLAATSRQIGKTTTLKTIIYKEGLERPGIEILVIASTLKQSRAIHFKPLFLGNDPIFDKKLVKEINKTDLTVTLKNGTVITCASAEAIDTLRGRTADIVIIDEGGHVDLDGILEVLQPVVSARQGQIIAVGTPAGRNAFYTYIQKGLLGSPSFTKGFRSWIIPITHSDVNIPFKEERIEQAQRTLSPHQYAVEYLVSFDVQEGLVYPHFDPDKNRSEKRFDHSRVLHIGIDFNVGVMNAAVCQIYVRPDSKIEDVHIVEELRLRNANTQKLVDEIKRRYCHIWAPHQIILYPDASGGSRKTSAGISVTDHSILRDAGFKLDVSSKNPAVQDRVNNLNAKIHNAKGDRQLFINPSCKYFIQALMSQTYTSKGEPEKGEGEYDYSGPADAIGYLVNRRYNLYGSFSYKQG